MACSYVQSSCCNVSHMSLCALRGMPLSHVFEGREMVYFHTNDIVIEMAQSSDTISLPRTLLSAITCTILHHLPTVLLLLLCNRVAMQSHLLSHSF